MAWLALGLLLAFVLLLVSLPALLSRLVDPGNIRLIRARCAELGLERVTIRPWPNHYGVHYVLRGRRRYARCRVRRGKVVWIGPAPETD